MSTDIDGEEEPDIFYIRNIYPKHCIIANINIHSLQNKFEEVKEWLTRNAFDILSVQETKIDKSFPKS